MTGCVIAMIQLSEASSRTRKMNASDRPMPRARCERALSSREVSSAMKTRLSMPSTISSAVSVNSAAQALASVNSASISFAFAEKPGDQEIDADRHERGLDIKVRLEIFTQGYGRERRPYHDKCDIERTQALDPQRVHETHRHESENRERDDDSYGDPVGRLKDIEIKRRQIPSRRKAAEIIVLRLHVAIGEIQRAAHRHHDARRNRQRLGQQAAGGDGKGRNEHVSDVIDHEV